MVVLVNVADIVVGAVVVDEVVVVDIVLADVVVGDVVVGNFVLSDVVVAVDVVGGAVDVVVVAVDVLSLHIFLRFIPNLPFSSYVYDRVKEEEEKKVNNLTIKALLLLNLN